MAILLAIGVERLKSPATMIDRPGCASFELSIMFRRRLVLILQPPEIEKPLSHSDMAQVVDQWHADYINLEQEELFELVMAANYLDIKPLLELSCAKVAS